MAFGEDARSATNNDQLVWCKYVVDNDTLYFSEVPNAELVFIPATSTLKIKGNNGQVGAEIIDMESDIVNNIERHVTKAVTLRDE